MPNRPRHKRRRRPDAFAGFAGYLLEQTENVLMARWLVGLIRGIYAAPDTKSEAADKALIDRAKTDGYEVIHQLDIDSTLSEFPVSHYALLKGDTVVSGFRVTTEDLAAVLNMASDKARKEAEALDVLGDLSVPVADSPIPVDAIADAAKALGFGKVQGGDAEPDAVLPPADAP